MMASNTHIVDTCPCCDEFQQSRAVSLPFHEIATVSAMNRSVTDAVGSGCGGSGGGKVDLSSLHFMSATTKAYNSTLRYNYSGLRRDSRWNIPDLFRPNRPRYVLLFWLMAISVSWGETNAFLAVHPTGPSTMHPPHQRRPHQLYHPQQQDYPVQLLSAMPTYDATLSDQSFSELYSDDIPAWLLERCTECNYVYPTLIQRRALDTCFGYFRDADDDDDDDDDKDNKDDENDAPNSMVILAQTGSGKTLTYLLPLLSKLQNRASVQAMIVVPTRELGLQVAAVTKRLVGRKFMVMSLLQGSQLKRQRAWAWAETPQVVIGTPTELLQMVQYGGLPRVSSIKTVVVDEVDACLVHNSAAALQGSLTSSSSSTSGGIGKIGGGGGSGNTATTLSSSSSALHVLLSKFLSPTYADEEDAEATGDGAETLLVVDNNNGHRKGKSKRKFRTKRQTLFCSATIPQHRYFLKQCKANQWTLEEPTFVCTSPGEALPPTLKHGYMVCDTKKKKLATLRRVIRKLSGPNNKKVLVFFDPSRPLEDIGMSLAQDLEGGVFFQDGKTQLDGGNPVVSVLRFEDSLSQRAGATKAFEESGTGKDQTGFRAMLTTDLAARGLDLLGITNVVHFDLPSDADTYLHRSGRAGRLGKKGQVVSILTPDQEFVLVRLSNALSIDVKCVGRQKAKT